MIAPDLLLAIVERVIAGPVEGVQPPKAMLATPIAHSEPDAASDAPRPGTEGV